MADTDAAPRLGRDQSSKKLLRAKQQQGHIWAVVKPSQQSKTPSADNTDQDVQQQDVTGLGKGVVGGVNEDVVQQQEQQGVCTGRGSSTAKTMERLHAGLRACICSLSHSPCLPALPTQMRCL